uniref:acylaminoacyl-peptidase n=1 Tax=Oryzias sinensis TaxID=183150 RepID=A0A8C8A469_9TELE
MNPTFCLCLHADWSQSDLVRGSRLHYSQQWTLIADTNNHKTVRTVLPPGPCTPVSGESVLSKPFCPIKCLNLTALNIHGRVYDDVQFGSLSWSECEGKLLYVAEKSRNSSAGGESACREDRNVYCEDWGEALTSKSVPVVCVVDLHSGAVDVLQGVPEDVSPGQALWAPGYQSVFFVGWYHEPFRLGLKFCEFAGVYETLSPCCWSADSQRVVFSSACRNWKFFTISLSAADLSAASRDCGSWKLLTIQRDLMVVCCSSPNTPPTLRVGFLPEKSEAMTWQTLQQPAMTFDFSWTSLDIKPPPEEDNMQYPGLDFGSVLVKPSRPLCDSRIPLVVFIHGGPHSQFPAEWNSTTAGLVKLGCAVLMVNYRGSTGFGQDSILSLIGNIGSQDVKDVQRAVLAALWSDETLDPKRVAVIGGSHGGFLCCHLVGQYPDFYKACAARNPVINAATLLGTSDIVDWRYTSAGFQFSYDSVPTAEVLAALLQKSPITHAVQIKAAVLLMLGGKDRRVSPHQGLELYKVLKSRASPVRLLWFPEDGHSLSRVDTQADCFVNTALWLQQHL